MWHFWVLLDLSNVPLHVVVLQSEGMSNKQWTAPLTNPSHGCSKIEQIAKINVECWLRKKKMSQKWMSELKNCVLFKTIQINLGHWCMDMTDNFEFWNSHFGTLALLVFPIDVSLAKDFCCFLASIMTKWKDNNVKNGSIVWKTTFQLFAVLVTTLWENESFRVVMLMCLNNENQTHFLCLDFFKHIFTKTLCWNVDQTSVVAAIKANFVVRCCVFASAANLLFVACDIFDVHCKTMLIKSCHLFVFFQSFFQHWHSAVSSLISNICGPIVERFTESSYVSVQEPKPLSWSQQVESIVPTNWAVGDTADVWWSHVHLKPRAKQHPKRSQNGTKMEPMCDILSPLAVSIGSDHWLPEKGVDSFALGPCGAYELPVLQWGGSSVTAEVASYEFCGCFVCQFCCLKHCVFATCGLAQKNRFRLAKINVVINTIYRTKTGPGMRLLYSNGDLMVSLLVLYEMRSCGLLKDRSFCSVSNDCMNKQIHSLHNSWFGKFEWRLCCHRSNYCPLQVDMVL